MVRACSKPESSAPYWLLEAPDLVKGTLTDQPVLFSVALEPCQPPWPVVGLVPSSFRVVALAVSCSVQALRDLTGSLLSAPVAASVVGGRVVLETFCSFLNNFARCRRLKYCTLGTISNELCHLDFDCISHDCSPLLLVLWLLSGPTCLGDCSEHFCVRKSVLEAKLGTSIC